MKKTPYWLPSGSREWTRKEKFGKMKSPETYGSSSTPLTTALSEESSSEAMHVTVPLVSPKEGEPDTLRKPTAGAEAGAGPVGGAVVLACKTTNPEFVLKPAPVTISALLAPADAAT